MEGRDGKVALEYGELPIPLLAADYDALGGELPDYDAVGRGIYQALRLNPDCAHALRYADILKQGYPHIISELAGQIIMLGEKDVEVPYLDRRVNYLKIFALLEPQSAQFPLEIGATLLEMGVRFSALERSTVTLFKAEAFLDRGLALAPEHLKGNAHQGEVCFLLGKYAKAETHWRRLLPELAPEARGALELRLARLTQGDLPRVPAVDYLQALAGALTLKDEGAFPEAVAILNDILSDFAFCREFPMAELPYLMALCCLDLGARGDAQRFLQQALALNPEYAEAQSALQQLQS